MYIIFIQHVPQSRKYNRVTSGWEFIDLITDRRKFLESVQALEGLELFPSAGADSLTRASGFEAYDPDQPDRVAVGDYTYYLEDARDLDPFYDDAKLTAIKEASTGQLREILDYLGIEHESYLG